jgi:glutathione peroxidase
MHPIFMLIPWIMTINFYSLEFADINGTLHTMKEYQGKKILLVNIATGSTHASQLSRLQELQQQYGDSLVVIGFPSNSFAKEVHDDVEINNICHDQYGVRFLLAQKNAVAGTFVQPVYQWLTNVDQNGALNEPISRDFQKFLVNESGQLIGVFSSSVDPFSPELISALQN